MEKNIQNIGLNKLPSNIYFLICTRINVSRNSLPLWKSHVIYIFHNGPHARTHNHTHLCILFV